MATINHQHIGKRGGNLLPTLIVVLAIISLSTYFLLTKPQRDDTARNGQLHVGATIFPIYDIARKIAGDDASVTLILPPGASPHSFEPTPSLISKLKDVSIIFTIGHGLDDWSGQLLTSLPKAKAQTVDQGITLLSGRDHLLEDVANESRTEPEVEEDEDPHYWLSPANAAIISNNIAQSLAQADSAHADAYNLRMREMQDTLANRDAQWKDDLALIENREIVTFHNAFSYFANHFNISIAASFEPFPGKEPTPRYLQALADTIDELALTTIFMEPQLSQTSIKQFVQDNELNIGVLDSIGGVPGRMDYIALIDYNVHTVRDLMQKK